MTCKEERKKIYYRYIDRKNFKNALTMGGGCHGIIET